MRLLLIEDNQALTELVSDFLRARGFAVTTASTGAQALALIENAFDAIILDLGLPDMDGMDVLRNIRAQGAVPTLILTARDAVAHRIAGLNAGADDYILKPFNLEEFEARLRAVLRRPGARDTPSPTFADISFDAACRSACRGDHAVELTRREAVLLEALIIAGEKIVVRDELTDRLYGVEEDVSANALEATVSRLRRKIAQLGSAVRIDSMRGVGYRLRRGATP